MLNFFLQIGVPKEKVLETILLDDTLLDRWDLDVKARFELAKFQLTAKITKSPRRFSLQS